MPTARRWVTWGLVGAGWTFLGVFFATQTYISYAYAAYRITWNRALSLALVEWYIWGALAPVIFWLAGKFRFESGGRLRAALVHVPASVIFALGHLFIYVWLSTYISPSQYPLGRRFGSFVPIKLHANLLTYWAIVAASHGADYYRRYRERELRNSQLQAKLAQAQLQVLKMQLHPHFLFNTLHAISTLMHRDVETADRMVARLSDLLRMTLESIGLQEVPLRQELEFLEPYLEIEQTRFQDRLTVQLDIQAEALDAQVPNMILQPLVENAIRHAIAPRAGAGRIEIVAAREDGMLRLEVRDDGPGVTATPSQGLGLANTRARLEQLYGDKHRFELANRPGGGFSVVLGIPCTVREQAAGA